MDKTHNDAWLYEHAFFDCMCIEDCASSLPADQLKIAQSGEPICQECATNWDDLPEFNPFPNSDMIKVGGWQDITSSRPFGMKVIVELEDGITKAYLVGERDRGIDGEEEYWFFVDLKGNEISIGGYTPKRWYPLPQPPEM